ncbi:MAG: isochorismatase family cysteine hydrolase [Actinomycetota bacterium]
MGDTSVEPRAHRWRIEEREIQRHIARRGRRHAFEHLDPTRTALVVIDLVPFFVAESGHARATIRPVNETAAVLRSLGGTVAWVVPGLSSGSPTALDEEFYGPAVAESYRRSGGDGPVRERLWPELDAQAQDLTVEKTAASAFFPGRCGLHEDLAARRIDSVLIAGTVANVCCESSARDARTLGYRVVMMADALAAPSDDMLNATLRTVYRSFGDVRPSVELQALLRSWDPDV